MVRRTKRWRAPPPKVLCEDSSRAWVECYAAQGKGVHNCAWVGATLDLVLIDFARNVRTVRGVQFASWEPRTDAVAFGSGWRILGWRMADGTALFGDYERVDPELADWEKLQEPNRPAHIAHGTSGSPQALHAGSSGNT